MQIKKTMPEKIKANATIIKLVVAAVAIILIYVFFIASDSDSDKPNPAIPIEAVSAKQQDIPFYLSGVGRVVSPHNVDIHSRVDGELKAIHFTEGQEVKQGDLLAEIDSRTILAEIAKAKADKASINAELQTAKLDLQRYRNLIKADAISKQAVDQQVAKTEQLQAQLQSAQAAIESNEVMLTYTKITSPVNGRVGIRRVDAGNIVKASDADGIVKITQIQPINAIFSLSQSALPQLQEVMKSKKSNVDAMLKEGNKIITTGSLEAIDNEVDQNTGTINLRAVFENKNNELWPGQLIVLRLHAGEHKQAVTVPIRAIQRGDAGNFVYVVKDNIAKITKVEIEFEDSELAVIKSGISASDIVVIDGHSRLRDGATVKINKKTAANGK